MNKINRMISNYNYNPGNISRIKYIVIHYVGALGGAQENCAYYGGGNRGASAHYFVGFAGEIWQCVEDRNIAWHCGASSYKHPECRNANSIGIEMCVRKKNAASLGATDKDWYFEGATVQSTVEEVKQYCEENNYKLDAQRFVDFYESKGWMIGKNKMKSWQAAVRTWVRKAQEGTKQDEEDRGESTSVRLW